MAVEPVRSRATLVTLVSSISIYVASRIVVLAVALVASQTTGDGLAELLVRWDGVTLTGIAKHGYGATLVTSAEQLPASLARFPGYPLAIRLLGFGHPIDAGVLISVLSGLFFVCGIALLLTRLYDQTVALRFVVLFSFFPLSFILMMAYAEGLYLAAVACCFYALFRRHLLISALFCGLASGIRPNGIALSLTIIILALLGVYRSRTLRSLLTGIAVVPLSISGAAAYLLWSWHVTGDIFAYSHVQSLVWDQGLDWGLNSVLTVWHLFDGHDPYFNLVSWSVAVVFALVCLFFLMVRPRLVAFQHVCDPLDRAPYIFSFTVFRRSFCDDCLPLAHPDSASSDWPCAVSNPDRHLRRTPWLAYMACPLRACLCALTPPRDEAHFSRGMGPGRPAKSGAPWGSGPVRTPDFVPAPPVGGREHAEVEDPVGQHDRRPVDRRRPGGRGGEPAVGRPATRDGVEGDDRSTHEQLAIDSGLGVGLTLPLEVESERDQVAPTRAHSLVGVVEGDGERFETDGPAVGFLPGHRGPQTVSPKVEGTCDRTGSSGVDHLEQRVVTHPHH